MTRNYHPVAVVHDRFTCTAHQHCWARLAAVCRCGEVLRGGSWQVAQRMTDADIAAVASGTVRQ
jgi:hypothetical protein